MPFSRLFDLYMADLDSRCSRTHAHNVRQQLRRISERVPNLSPIALLAYRQDRIKIDGVSHRTANADIKALSSCFEWGLRAGLATENPYRLIRRLPERQGDLRKRRRAMTDEEMSRFLRASCERDAELERDYEVTLLWRTFLETGMRWGELSMVTGAELHGETIILSPDRTKTREARSIPLRPALAAKLRRRARNGSPIFRTPRGSTWLNNRKTALCIFYDTLERADIPRVDAMGRSLDIHATRWSFISRAQRRGVPEPMIALMVGHASTRPGANVTTRGYTDLTVEDLRRELRRRMWR